MADLATEQLIGTTIRSRVHIATQKRFGDGASRDWSAQLLKPNVLICRAVAAARPISRFLIGCVGIALVLTTPGYAEDPPRRVGSLNYISGEVAYALRGEVGEPGGSDALSWSQADFNQPVCQDMSLKTGAMARARVRIGPDAIQMSGDTLLNMLNLSDRLIEASIRYGRIHLQLSKLDDGETVELEMPRGSLWLLQPGAYDIDTGSGADDQPTRIVVFEGKARFVGGQADLPIGAGEEVQLTGSYPAVVASEHSATAWNPTAPVSIPTTPTTAPAPAESNPPQAVLPPSGPQPKGLAQAGEPTPPPAHKTEEGQPGSAKAPAVTADVGQAPSDDFLLWVENTDNQPHPSSPSTRFVSSETTGYDALDRYGRWDTLPDSEAVWYPTSVPDDWAPYRFGHWDSIEPWGWTWIDDQPWGFAPFHYGRWINVDGHWGWVPGNVVPHPVYAPALVAFIDAPDNPGGGPNGGPDVGWFPLGPGDDYSPWYPAGPDYVEQVNVVERGHFGEFAGHDHDGRGREAWRAQYFNRRYATVVSREAFADARRIDRATMRIPADRLEHAALMRGAPHIVPAAMRPMAPPGEFHGEPRGSAPLAAGGRRNQSGGANQAAQHEAETGRVNAEGAGRRGGPVAAGQSGRAGERPGQVSSRSEIGYRPAHAEHTGSQQFGRSEVGRNPTEGYHGSAQQFGRPQVSQGFHGGAEQFGRPQVAQGFRGGAEQFGRPQVAQGFHGGAEQFGRPQVAQGFRGGAEQFGRPQVTQGFRGGAEQFGRPQVFQTPAASYRGGGMMGRATPQMTARPVATRPSVGGGGGRHK